jgi:hypothetical protein
VPVDLVAFVGRIKELDLERFLIWWSGYKAIHRVRVKMLTSSPRLTAVLQYNPRLHNPILLPQLLCSLLCSLTKDEDVVDTLLSGYFPSVKS